MKSKYLISSVIGVVVLAGVFYFVSKNNKTPTPVISLQEQEETVAEDSIYEHVHSVFRIPNDNTILIGTHTGLFKSTDNGKTFVRAQIKSSDSSVNPDGEFMNFAYDSVNKILYGGTHDSGLLKSADFGLAWSKSDSGIDGQDIHGLAINPLDTNLIYAYSVNKGLFGTKDGAKSWYKIDDGPKNPNVKGFAYMATLTSMDRNMRREGSTNIGYLWAGTGGGLESSFACFCGWTLSQEIPKNTTVYTLAADPLNKSAMLVAEKDGLYRTTDEAKTFTRVSSELKDVGALWFDIENQKTVFAATNNGMIYESNDSGVSWDKK
jgi:photosystem II stability/assembly factor-like uncharacterized protein